MDEVFLKAVKVYNFVVEEACILLMNYLENKQQIETNMDCMII